MGAIELLQKDQAKEKFKEILGENAGAYITTVMSIISSNDLLKNADPQSVYLASLNSACLNLPINPNLGFAYILPYNQKDGPTLAQFQLGYKGFIQLAQRSGLYKTISACPVYEGQLIEENPLTGFVFDWKQKKSDTVIGYAGYFSLMNGFEKVLYMHIEELKKHGKKYSKSYKKGYGLRETDFEAMALKTVLKLLISKYGPMSVDLQKAITTDQAVIKGEEEFEYIDNDGKLDFTKEEENNVLEGFSS